MWYDGDKFPLLGVCVRSWGVLPLQRRIPFSLGNQRHRWSAESSAPMTGKNHTHTKRAHTHVCHAPPLTTQQTLCRKSIFVLTCLCLRNWAYSRNSVTLYGKPPVVLSLCLWIHFLFFLLLPCSGFSLCWFSFCTFSAFSLFPFLFSSFSFIVVYCPFLCFSHTNLWRSFLSHPLPCKYFNLLWSWQKFVSVPVQACCAAIWCLSEQHTHTGIH